MLTKYLSSPIIPTLVILSQEQIQYCQHQNKQLQPLRVEDFSIHNQVFKHFHVQDNKLIFFVKITLPFTSDTSAIPYTGTVETETLKASFTQGLLGDITPEDPPYKITLNHGRTLTITNVADGHIKDAKLQDPKGNSFTGTFNNNAPYTGILVTQFAGRTYEERLIASQIQDIGKYEMTTSAQSILSYEGHLAHGVANGAGTFIHNDIQITGRFQNQVLDHTKECQIRYPDGKLFKGRVVPERRSKITDYRLEQGIITFPKIRAELEASQYKGTFKDNQPFNGTGSWDDTEKHYTQIGSFQHGKLVGKGTIIFVDQTVSGDFPLELNSSNHGTSFEGSIVLLNGLTFHGTINQFNNLGFPSDYRYKEGTVTFPNQRTYTGTCRHNKPWTGKGCWVTSDSEKIGYWVDGQYSEHEIVIVADTHITIIPIQEKGHVTDGKKEGLFRQTAKSTKKGHEFNKSGIINYEGNIPKTLVGWYTDPNVGLDKTFYCNSETPFEKIGTNYVPHGPGISIIVEEESVTTREGLHHNWEITDLGLLTYHDPDTSFKIWGRFINGQPFNEMTTVYDSKPGSWDVWYGNLSKNYEREGEGIYIHQCEQIDSGTYKHDKEIGASQSFYSADISGVPLFRQEIKEKHITVIQRQHHTSDGSGGIDLSQIHMRLNTWWRYEGECIAPEHILSDGDSSPKIEFIPHGRGVLINLGTGKESKGLFEMGRLTTKRLEAVQSMPPTKIAKTAEEVDRASDRAAEGLVELSQHNPLTNKEASHE